MQDAEKVYVKLACVQNVSDECNLITVICYRVEELIVSVLINKTWMIAAFSWMKIMLTWDKKIIISERPFQCFFTILLLSFDWSLSCKLQLIDLIMVFATFLVGRQTIVVSFFSQERKNRKETNGWKNKSATGRYRYRFCP